MDPQSGGKSNNSSDLNNDEAARGGSIPTTPGWPNEDDVNGKRLPPWVLDICRQQGGPRPDMLPVTPQRVKRIDPIEDHEGNKVEIVWYPIGFYKNDLPGFSYQVYFTKHATNVAKDETFPATLAATLERWRLASFGIRSERTVKAWRYHLEFYTQPQANYHACAEHQRREIRHRRIHGIRPCMVDGLREGAWLTYILVIEKDDWANDGVTFVCFDWTRLKRRGETLCHPIFHHTRGVRTLEVAWHQKFSREANLDAQSVIDIMKVIYEIECGRRNAQELEDRNLKTGPLDPATDPEGDPVSGDENHAAGDRLELFYGTKGMADVEYVLGEVLRQVTRKSSGFFKTSVYDDGFGVTVTSVWDSRKSISRPPFSMTLYVAADLPSDHSVEWFTFINSGLLAAAPWTLDVVTGVQSVSGAFELHKRTSALRSEVRTTKRRACTRMLIDKISSNALLPAELWSQIENILVPPELPDYSQDGYRASGDVFLYLDFDKLVLGPLMISSRFPAEEQSFDWHDELLAADPTAAADAAFDLRVELGHMLSKVQTSGSWERLRDGIHTMWSICSPRFNPAEPLPTLWLTLKPEPTFGTGRSGQGHDFSPDEVPEDDGRPIVKVMGQIDSERPITIHMYRLDPMLEAVNLTTGEISSVEANSPAEVVSQWSASWTINADLTSHEEDRVLRELLPNGPPIRLNWWVPDPLPQESLFTTGTNNSPFVDEERTKTRCWRVRIKPNLTIPRWRYGRRDANAQDEVHNMPPMPVKVRGREELYITRGWYTSEQRLRSDECYYVTEHKPTDEECASFFLAVQQRRTLGPAEPTDAEATAHANAAQQ